MPHLPELPVNADFKQQGQYDGQNADVDLSQTQRGQRPVGYQEKGNRPMAHIRYREVP